MTRIEKIEELIILIKECIEDADERTTQYARLQSLLDKFNQLVKL